MLRRIGATALLLAAAAAAAPALAAAGGAVIDVELDARAHEQPHRCVHDEKLDGSRGVELRASAQRYEDDLHANATATAAAPERRKRQQDVDVRPLRVHFDLANLGVGERTCQAGDNGRSVVVDNERFTCRDEYVLTDELRASIARVLPRVAVRVSEMLSTVPVVGALRTRFDQCRVSGMSLDTTRYQRNGAASVEADVVVLVTSYPTSGSTLAWAGACEIDQFGRPTFGFMNIGPNNMRGRDDESFTATVTHELFHILGFNAAGFERSVDEFGARLAESDVLRRANVFVDDGTPKSAGFVHTPEVLRRARAHFDCPDLVGLELEDRGVRRGSYGSHWEERVLRDEVMTPANADGEGTVSELTLALFHDSGHYVAQFAQAEPLAAGFRLGCGYALRRCAAWPRAAALPLEVCDVAGGGNTCSPSRRGFSTCGFSKTGDGSCVEPWARVSDDDCSLTGRSAYGDGCALASPYVDCTSGANFRTDDAEVYGQSVGAGGTCVHSNFIQSGFRRVEAGLFASCHRLRCVGQPEPTTSSTTTTTTTTTTTSSSTTSSSTTESTTTTTTTTEEPTTSSTTTTTTTTTTPAPCGTHDDCRSCAAAGCGWCDFNYGVRGHCADLGAAEQCRFDEQLRTLPSACLPGNALDAPGRPPRCTYQGADGACVRNCFGQAIEATSAGFARACPTQAGVACCMPPSFVERPPPADEDGDGVPDDADVCSLTPPGLPVWPLGHADAGCSGRMLRDRDDGDRDSVFNGIDRCPRTPLDQRQRVERRRTSTRVGCAPGETPHNFQRRAADADADADVDEASLRVPAPPQPRKKRDGDSPAAGVTMQVLVGDTWMDCPADGSRISVASNRFGRGPEYSGELECPDPGFVCCGDCRNGRCMHGHCLCARGWTGASCSERIPPAATTVRRRSPPRRHASFLVERPADLPDDNGVELKPVGGGGGGDGGAGSPGGGGGGASQDAGAKFVALVQEQGPTTWIVVGGALAAVALLGTLIALGVCFARRRRRGYVVAGAPRRVVQAVSGRH